MVLWTEPGPPPPIAGLWTPSGVSAGVSNPRPRAVAGPAPLTGLVTEERRETGVLTTSTCQHHPGAAAGQAHRTSGPRAEPGCGHALPKKGGMPVVRGLLRPGSGNHDFSADRAGKAPAAATFPPLGPCRHSACGIQLREPAVRTRHRLRRPGRGSSAGSAGPRASRKVRAQRQLETES